MKGYAVTRSTNVSPYIWAWPWDNGFGVQFANPVSLPTYYLVGVGINAKGTAILYGLGNLGGMEAYHLSESGFGTKYSNPGFTTNASIKKIVFLKDNSVFIASGGNMQLFAAKWDDSTGFGTKYSTPAGLVGVGEDCDFSPSGDVAIYASSGASSPYIHAYPFSYSLGFGVKFSDPSTPLPYQNYGATFSPDGSVIICNVNNPGIFAYIPSAYAWDDNTGFGVKYANPSIVANSQCLSNDFSPHGDAVFFGVISNPWMYAYPWDNTTGFGVKYGNPVTLPPGGGVHAIDNDGDVKVVMHGVTAPCLRAYNFDATTGFGTVYSTPAGVNPVYSKDIMLLPSSVASILINITEAWKEMGIINTYIDGSWKEVVSIKVNIYGVWKDLV